jgi:hypothetical protein
MPNGPRDVAISGDSRVCTVEQENPLVGKEDHRAEGAALGQGIVLIPGGRHVRDNVDARRVGRVLGNRPVLDPLIRFEVATTTEQDGGYIVVRGGEGEHDGAARSGVGPDGMRDVRKGVFDVVLVIEDLGAPVGLDEEISGGEKPGEGEEVGREGGEEDVQADGLASGRVEFVRGVVLTSVVYETGGGIGGEERKERNIR